MLYGDGEEYHRPYSSKLRLVYTRKTILSCVVSLLTLDYPLAHTAG